MFLKIFLLGVIFNYMDLCFGEPQTSTVSDNIGVYKSCFEDLGCIETTAEWFHRTHRPRNLEPLDRHTIRTEFILITKDVDETKPLNYDIVFARKESLSLSGYKKDKGLILLIHDFTSNGRTGWVKHIVTSLTTKLNIVSVDWEAGAEPPFEQAIANARVVALEIKAFVEAVQDGCTPHPIHIISHGVGAHIAGYVGSYVNVTKITGLDPTGPLFENMPPVVRLDPTDATYVEVLHTDAFNSRSQGAKTRLGHIDFFFNGALLQPQCNQSNEYPVFTKLDRNTLKEGVILPACSHKRSFKYYIEALQSNECEFTGIGCTSYTDFAEGKCTSCGSENNKSNCATFGTSVTTLVTHTRSLYLNTRGEPPYCLNSYSVKIHFENNVKAKKFQEGSFELIMINEKGVMINATASYVGIKKHTHRFESGKTKTLVYYATEPRIVVVQEARLKWLHTQLH
ncbi:hypothetical protein ILUMI_21034 [Ignelater luminosus]|uniref:Lipase domain-containing protein n=1 Tax=Ignelater luminosus TaxID=2038154 RepID=A0A8K0G1S6_IGNLU|nr:hypothetical protein ILUMI_21034 [Ignelater luminosus]